MADPDKYERDYAFTSSPSFFPAPQLNNEFANLETASGELVEAIKDVRRSDGALPNEKVTLDSLHPTVRGQIGEGALAARDAAALSATAAAVSEGSAAASATTASTQAAAANAHRLNAYNAQVGAEAARDVTLGAVPNTFSPTRTELKALDTTTKQQSYLFEVGREGQFVWRVGDYSAQVAADPLEGLYLKADAVAATVGAWVRVIGGKSLDPRWFGAAADGTGDDTAAIQAAINLDRGIDFGEGVYSAVNLDFNQPRHVYCGQGAVLLFKGDTTNRLANINASAVIFDGVFFDGDLRQPRGGLVRVNDDCAKPIFINGAVRNMFGNVAGAEATNSMSGLSVSPYGVTGLFIHNMDFENLRKSNDGTYYPITEGYGFVSAIEFGLEGGGDTSTPQVIPSGGIITGNRFNIIETILAPGSTLSQLSIYDDGQAIRTIANEAGSYSLDLLIGPNTYRRCSKRALKIRHSGVVCDGSVVWASEGAFAMSAVFDNVIDSVLRNSTVYVSNESKLPQCIAKIDVIGNSVVANRFLVIDGLEAEACVTLIEATNVFAGRPFENTTLRNVTCPRVSRYGFIHTGFGASVARNNLLEGWRIGGLGDNARAVEWAVPDLDGNCGLTIRDFEAANMDVAIIGHDADIDMKLKVTSPTFAGVAGASLFRYSAGDFTAGSRPSRIRSVDIDAMSLADAFLVGRSLGVAYISAPQMVMDRFKLALPDAYPTTSAHATFGGADSSFQDIDYFGPGRISFGGLGAIVRAEIEGIVRRGGGATTSTFLIFNNAANDAVLIRNVRDFRPCADSPIRLESGVAGTPYEIDGVRARTTNAAIVGGTGGAALAVITNAVKF